MDTDSLKGPSKGELLWKSKIDPSNHTWTAKDAKSKRAPWADADLVEPRDPPAFTRGVPRKPPPATEPPTMPAPIDPPMLNSGDIESVIFDLLKGPTPNVPQPQVVLAQILSQTAENPKSRMHVERILAHCLGQLIGEGVNVTPNLLFLRQVLGSLGHLPDSPLGPFIDVQLNRAAFLRNQSAISGLSMNPNPIMSSPVSRSPSLAAASLSPSTSAAHVGHGGHPTGLVPGLSPGLGHSSLGHSGIPSSSSGLGGRPAGMAVNANSNSSAGFSRIHLLEAQLQQATSNYGQLVSLQTQMRHLPPSRMDSELASKSAVVQQAVVNAEREMKDAQVRLAQELDALRRFQQPLSSLPSIPTPEPVSDLSEIPPALTDFDRMLPMWKYRSGDGTVRGPYSTDAMVNWARSGRLPRDLQVSFHILMPFVPLNRLFDDDDSAFSCLPLAKLLCMGTPYELVVKVFNQYKRFSPRQEHVVEPPLLIAPEPEPQPQPIPDPEPLIEEEGTTAVDGWGDDDDWHVDTTPPTPQEDVLGFHTKSKKTRRKSSKKEEVEDGPIRKGSTWSSARKQQDRPPVPAQPLRQSSRDVQAEPLLKKTDSVLAPWAGVVKQDTLGDDVLERSILAAAEAQKTQRTPSTRMAKAKKQPLSELVKPQPRVWATLPDADPEVVVSDSQPVPEEQPSPKAWAAIASQTSASQASASQASASQASASQGSTSQALAGKSRTFQQSQSVSALGQMSTSDWADTPVKPNKSVEPVSSTLSASQFRECQILKTRHRIDIEGSLLDYFVEANVSATDSVQRSCLLRKYACSLRASPLRPLKTAGSLRKN